MKEMSFPKINILIFLIQVFSFLHLSDIFFKKLLSYVLGVFMFYWPSLILETLTEIYENTYPACFLTLPKKIFSKKSGLWFSKKNVFHIFFRRKNSFWEKHSKSSSSLVTLWLLKRYKDQYKLFQKQLLQQQNNILYTYKYI